MNAPTWYSSSVRGHLVRPLTRWVRPSPRSGQECRGMGRFFANMGEEGFTFLSWDSLARFGPWWFLPLTTSPLTSKSCWKKPSPNHRGQRKRSLLQWKSRRYVIFKESNIARQFEPYLPQNHLFWWMAWNDQHLSCWNQFAEANLCGQKLTIGFSPHWDLMYFNFQHLSPLRTFT